MTYFSNIQISQHGDKANKLLFFSSQKNKPSQLKLMDVMWHASLSNMLVYTIIKIPQNFLVHFLHLNLNFQRYIFASLGKSIR